MRECYDITPVLNKSQPLAVKEFQFVKNNYVIFNSKIPDMKGIQDLITGDQKIISSKYLGSCDRYLAINNDFFRNENFDELIQKEYKPLIDYEKVEEIKSEDILIKSDSNYVYLNDNRYLLWTSFRRQSDQDIYAYGNTFCIMYNEFLEKLYVCDQQKVEVQGHCIYSFKWKVDQRNFRGNEVQLCLCEGQLCLSKFRTRRVIGLTNEEIIKELTLNVEKYLKFISGYGTVFNLFQNNLAALEVIIKQLSIKDRQILPILICQKMLGGESPLDFSIKNHQQKIINLILSMITKYQDHILFNQLIDKNLCELIKQQIDLQEYFQSNLPNYEILDLSFPSQHPDEQELIEGITLDNPKDVHSKYDELFGRKLNNNAQQDDFVASIEYHLINLPVTLKEKPQQLMNVLSQTENPEYFENKTIQTIINFKWNQYTKQFYKNRFYVYLIFMASFIFDIFYSTYASQSNSDPTQQDGEAVLETTPPNIWLKISTKVICGGVLIYFLIYEIQQIRVQKGEYFNDGWNYFDFSHILAFTTFCILDFTSESQEYLILIKILVIVLSFMKLFFFLRIYDGFSFLVQMMAGVFKDLKYFMMFFIIIILQFGMIFLVLFQAKQIDEYNGINKLAYFLMAFRISSGDFQLDDYHSQEDGLVIFTWMIWLVAVLTLNIVFMNFIIAVISESYERVMQKLVAESYRVKAHMIVEREQLFNREGLESISNFPNFIVVRRPLNTETNDAGEWQGFIKDLKYTIRTTAAKSKGELIQSLHSIQTQNVKNGQKLQKIDEAFELNSKNVSLEEKISKLQQNSKNDFDLLKSEFNTKVDSIDDQVKGLKNDMEFIKSSLTQILQKVDQ
ncbi:UNKNOWN [Stylonychia lemnae]|uniref:Ion transport domain-containing protein n=1 Tax=Stylonychia lemnae TaxID=5949 RepID=A0A078AVZ3_STYLE|nr:UNKNOWN [Stylonychia lemnae]|eukprot:CDW84948.1 UNKNOWN [Stylonychia lemnae]